MFFPMDRDESEVHVKESLPWWLMFIMCFYYVICDTSRSSNSHAMFVRSARQI